MQQSDKILIEAIKSPLITKKDDLVEVLIKLLKNHHLREGDILLIASKVIAVTQGQIVKIKTQKAFDELVAKEADEIIGGKEVTLTVKNNIFIAWAGIDRSNIEKGSAVLWPKNTFAVAESLRKSLQEILKIKKLGIIITDSCCMPLRRGVSGVALAYSGFQGVNDLRGHKDLYGNTLKVTQQAVADNLATAAHLVMGESDESKPFVIIRNAPVTFTDQKPNKNTLSIKKTDCLFAPFYQSAQQKKRR